MWSRSGPSPLLSYRHIYTTQTGNLNPTHTRRPPMAQRKGDGGMVVAGAVGRVMPTSSWGSHFDSKDEAGAAQAVSRSCRCLPPSLPFFPSLEWHRVPAPWHSGPHTSTKREHKLDMVTATPWLFCVSSWQCHSSTPSTATCCSFKLLSMSCYLLPISQGGPWVSEQHGRGTRVTDAPRTCLTFLGWLGSRLILLLISSSPRALVTLSSCAHTSLPSLPCNEFSPSHRDAHCICGISLIINKTYIYTVCCVEMCVALALGTMGYEVVFKALGKKSMCFRELWQWMGSPRWKSS